MPKKINNIYNLRQDNIYSNTILSNSSRFNSRDNSRSARDTRNNIGSVFSNESSQFSIAKDQKTDMSNRVPSNDNISITVCNEQDPASEASRHISFNLFKDNHENKSLNSSVNRIGSGIINEQLETEANRLSTGIVITKTGPALSQENIKSASITHINQKRNSIKRRPSLKYRDRAHRLNNSSSFINRKLSHANSQSDDRQDFESSHQNPALEESVLIIAEENSHPNHVAGVTFSGVQTPDNFECEVDEVDFNRCFPWVKIVIRLFAAINFDCGHYQTNHQTSNPASQIQIKNRRHLIESCTKECHLKLFKNSHSLIEAVLRMYETSTNCDMFEKYKKQLDSKTKEQVKGSTRIKDSGFKGRKNSQISSNSQKIFFINNILKKTNNINKQSINSQILANSQLPSPQGTGYETLRSKIERNKDRIPTMDYVYTQVHFLNHIPLQILCKSVLVMTDDLFVDVCRFTWNLLLNSDQEMASSAATLFLIGSTKQQAFVEELMRSELRSKNVEIRYRAVLKFEALWKFRYDK